MKYPTLGQILFYLFCLAVLRKICCAFYAMNIVRIHWDEVSFERMASSSEVSSMISSLPKNQETFVLILNRHALNMTMNWLCNTAEIPGVHESSLIVSLDQESSEVLRAQWPNIKQLKWIVPGLANPFNYGDGYYQLFYLFRSNLARTLLHFNRTFWMIQQDTFWTESLARIPLPAADIVFDRASNGGPLIAGGYYRAAPTSGSKAYFEKLSRDISWWYVPDNAYMTSLCELSGLARCGGLPFNLITNWQWLDSDAEVQTPKFIQFDGETQLGSKLDKMRKMGFYFLNEDRRTCNQTTVELARLNLNSEKPNWNEVTSYSHGQFKFYQSIVDNLYSNPYSAWFLNRIILPYAHYCMLTL